MVVLSELSERGCCPALCRVKVDRRCRRPGVWPASPTWSADGRIAFDSNRDGNKEKGPLRLVIDIAH